MVAGAITTRRAVGIAQLVERLVVVQEGAGSSPVIHPGRVRSEPHERGSDLAFFGGCSDAGRMRWRISRTMRRDDDLAVHTAGLRMGVRIANALEGIDAIDHGT